MTRIITYSLKADSANSDEYHQVISTFAETWLTQTLPDVTDLVTGFRGFQQDRSDLDRSDAEYAFELLALGVLLQEYSREITHTPRWQKWVMPRLVAIQSKVAKLEKGIKALRGWLGWKAGQASGVERNGDLIGLLIDWLRANDEAVKAGRFTEWREYFQPQGERFIRSTLTRCLDLAGEFEASSRETLGRYTENVERFLREEAPQHRRRYDARLLSRTRLEYHLGMLGTEILNRSFRQRFTDTKRKMVIVPPCMCAPAETCQAVETPFGAQCQACTPGCRVNQLTKLGEKRGFAVTMIPDDVKVFHSGNGQESIGLVGISCALTNWNGGWEAGAAGIPAQGLLLDYVGCKIHWDKLGIPTDTNVKRLQEILGE